MAEYLMPEKKQELFAKYGKSNTDTGSPESQVALFSYRIAHLTEHLKSNKKDYPKGAPQSVEKPEFRSEIVDCQRLPLYP